MSFGRARARLKRWKDDPVAFVRENFAVEPDAWQADGLRAFPGRNRMAFKSAKGPGKSTLLAWFVWLFLATRPYAKVAATSISGDNLQDGLWAELAKWQQRSEFLRTAFTWTKTRIVNNQASENWFCSARTWRKDADPQQQADTLSGLHADHILFVLDEAGGIPQAVMVTAEAVLASGIEAKIVIAGNPTQTDGPLYRACNEEAHLWHVTEITGDPDDPKRSPRINIEYAREMIAKYGRDNPWVQVNILGKFPPSSLNTLIGPEEVRAAMKRQPDPDIYQWSQKRLGIDVARFGGDATVLFPRQGLRAFRPATMRGARTTDIAARAAQAIVKWGVEETLVDDTGHWGHGVIDNLITAGYHCIPVVYHGKATDPRFRNVRTEMWVRMTEWVKRGGALPEIPELIGELSAPTYSFINGLFAMEPKDQIKARLGRSPDSADALANTFALPEAPSGMRDRLRRLTGRNDLSPSPGHDRAQIEFDPHEDGQRKYSHALMDFDPFP